MPFRLVLLLGLFLAALPGHASGPDGEALYRQHCAACHGYDGMGGVGIPLALPDFQYSVTNRYLKTTIREGRPGRIMPAFPSLGNKEIDALVKYIRRWAPGKPFRYPVTPVRGDAARGQLLFKRHCAACHGPNGEGGKGTGVTFSRPRDLPIIAPALNNRGFLNAASDQFIKATLMNGREGTPMVSFLKQGLTEKDINDIVVFIRSFEKNRPPPRKEILETDQATIVFESSYDLETTVNNIKDAAVGNNFIIIREQTLDDGLVPPGKENPKQRIIYFCNFAFLNKALLVDPRVGLFLPCRVTVVEKDGKVLVYAINPTRLSRLFNNTELNQMCHEMNDTYISIIEDATL
ncbi:MAG TPA: c-type cytochrome [Chromatiales bacterium]|nr:c-type cytochrome [Chromatiales bacterium]